MHPPPPPILLQKNDLLSLFSLTKKRIHMDSHLKEEHTDLFWKFLGILYPHRQSVNGYITIL